MTKDNAKRLVEIYGKAWVDQDVELVLTIFTPDAVCVDSGCIAANYGHAEIKKYWNEKIIGKQKDINFKLINIWVDGDTVIAEWDADFIDIEINVKITLTEVAIFTVKDDKFSLVRGYYKTNKTVIGI